MHPGPGQETEAGGEEHQASGETEAGGEEDTDAPLPPEQRTPRPRERPREADEPTERR
ncbi:hypothetical protein GCM10010282_68820 [Streptomyces roseolus]|nr:hypothetical protein GCM10010282_68820 [Streptomyces roseolus]